MALIRAFAGALSGTFADQWLDIITVGQFDEHAVLMPGIYQETNRDRGSNTKHSEAVISNGSRIYVPENTAAFIFDQSGIENIIKDRLMDGWSFEGYVPVETRGIGDIETLSLIFQKDM